MTFRSHCLIASMSVVSCGGRDETAEDETDDTDAGEGDDTDAGSEATMDGAAGGDSSALSRVLAVELGAVAIEVGYYSMAPFDPECGGHFGGCDGAEVPRFTLAPPLGCAPITDAAGPCEKSGCPHATPLAGSGSVSTAGAAAVDFSLSDGYVRLELAQPVTGTLDVRFMPDGGSEALVTVEPLPTPACTWRCDAADCTEFTIAWTGVDTETVDLIAGTERCFTENDGAFSDVVNSDPEFPGTPPLVSGFRLEQMEMVSTEIDYLFVATRNLVGCEPAE